MAAKKKPATKKKVAKKADGLLTAKMEMFCNCIADGMTQADAYRASYAIKKMSNKTIQESASRLMADGKIYARVAELKAKLEKKQLWTRALAVQTLGLIAIGKKGAPSKASNSDKIRAVTVLNDMHGFNVPELENEDAEPLTITFNVKKAVSEIKITNAKP